MAMRINNGDDATIHYYYYYYCDYYIGLNVIVVDETKLFFRPRTSTIL